MLSNEFSVEFNVRDYELDMFGIVNNSVYQNYLEHTRHVFFTQNNIEISSLVKCGRSAVVTEIHIKYKSPLKSGDSFVSTINVKKIGNVRIVFLQEIRKKEDRKPILSAEVTCAFLNEMEKPIPVPDEIRSLLGAYLIN